MEPIAAACVAVIARDPLRILWAKRSADASVLPSFHVVPGGLVDPTDHRAPRDDDSEVARVTGLRELFEETGLLIADPPPSEAQRLELRAELRADIAIGAERFAALGLKWRTSALRDLGRWVTPSIAPRRFDARFYAIDVDVASPVDPGIGELESVEWIEPQRAFDLWSRARVRIGPPVAAILRALLRDGAPDRARDALTSGHESLRWEVVPDVQMLPLRTPTLPPATHTNSFLVGRTDAVFVEPATPYPKEQERLRAWIDEARRSGIRPIAIVATHHHADHIGGAAALSAAFSLPIWAHRETASRVSVPIDRVLEDGETIELGDLALECIHTPGHAPGHICLLERRSGAMIAGDMVAGEGTILVQPLDGDMQLYLQSLERMGTFEPTVFLPAHGGPMDDPPRVIEHYVRHRLARERRVLDALRRLGRGSAIDLLPDAYGDVSKLAWPIAALSTESHLIKLEREGAVRREGDVWIASESTESSTQ